MCIDKQYNAKLKTADEAVKVLKSGDWLDYGWATTTPIALDIALSKRIIELNNINIRGGILMWVPEIFKINNPGEHFIWNSWHMSGIERKAVEAGYAYYIPLRYSELPRYYREMDTPPNVVMCQVAPMDSHGYFNFGPSTSHMMACCERAETVIVEVNSNMPICLGGFEESIHISRVDVIVEGNNPQIEQLGGEITITEEDQKVAKLVVEDIPDGACIQLGIGGMPNAVGTLIAESDLKNLGVHTEMYVDAFVDITKAGKINGSNKKIDRFRQTYAFAAGTKKLYDFIDNNPECMAAPVDYTNDIRIISALENFISINSAIEVDLYGQVNSESSGIRHISGAGGQLDFVLGAYLSKNGKSFICCPSTYKDRSGKIKSRITPTFIPGSIVTDTRANIHYLVTEYGKVNLKGLSTWQRCEAIISVAHPDFREWLITEAEKMRIWKKSNK